MYGMCMYMCLAGGSKVSWEDVGQAKAGVPDWSAHSIYEFEFDTTFPSFLLQ